MRLEILKDWRVYRPGMIIEPGGGVADILIRQGIARVVPDEPQQAGGSRLARKKKARASAV